MTKDSPLLRDILNQPPSLAETVDYQFGDGKPALHAAARLMSGKPILLSGMGSSLYACQALSAEWAEQGIPSSVIDTAELLHYHYSAYREAVAVLVSRSGESIETVKLLPLLKAQGTRLIGVTDVADSTLAREADVTVLIRSGKDQMVAVQSYTATLITLHLLGAALVNAVDTAYRELKSAIKLLIDYIPQCVEQSVAWQSFFSDTQVIHLLGRGCSIAAIYEGALLFNEVAKFPSVFEIIPVQCAALRVAEWRGFTPGEFRVATQVTRSEASFG